MKVTHPQRSTSDIGEGMVAHTACPCNLITHKNVTRTKNVQQVSKLYYCIFYSLGKTIYGINKERTIRHVINAAFN